MLPASLPSPSGPREVLSRQPCPSSLAPASPSERRCPWAAAAAATSQAALAAGWGAVRGPAAAAAPGIPLWQDPAGSSGMGLLCAQSSFGMIPPGREKGKSAAGIARRSPPPPPPPSLLVLKWANYGKESERAIRGGRGRESDGSAPELTPSSRCCCRPEPLPGSSARVNAPLPPDPPSRSAKPLKQANHPRSSLLQSKAGAQLQSGATSCAPPPCATSARVLSAGAKAGAAQGSPRLVELHTGAVGGRGGGLESPPGTLPIAASLARSLGGAWMEGGGSGGTPCVQSRGVCMGGTRDQAGWQRLGLWAPDCAFLTLCRLVGKGPQTP